MRTALSAKLRAASRRRFVPASPSGEQGATLERRALAAPLGHLWHRYNPVGTLDGVTASVLTPAPNQVGQASSDYTIDPNDPNAPAITQWAHATWTLTQTSNSMYGSITYTNTGTVDNKIVGEDPSQADPNFVKVDVTSSGTQSITGTGYGSGPTMALDLTTAGYRSFYFSPTPGTPPPTTVALIEHFHAEFDAPQQAVIDGEMSFGSTSAQLAFGAGQTPVLYPHSVQTNYPWTTTILSQGSAGSWASAGGNIGTFDATLKTVFVLAPGHTAPQPTNPPAPDWALSYYSGFSIQMSNVHGSDAEAMKFHYDATFVQNT